MLADEIPYAKFAPEVISSAEDSEAAARRDARAETKGETVWGKATVRDILRAKRAKRGVKLGDKAELASYHERKAALHTISDTTPVAEAMKQLYERHLTFLMITSEGGNVCGIVSERHFVNLTVGVAADAASTISSASDLLGAEVMKAPVSQIMTPSSQMLSVRTDQKADRCLALMIGSSIVRAHWLGGWAPPCIGLKPSTNVGLSLTPALASARPR